MDPTGMFLIAIDGTGTEDWLTAPQNPKKLPNGRWLSHVRNFFDDYNGLKYYDYGPRRGTTAADLVRIENKAYDTFKSYVKRKPSLANEMIDLIGWSRGAYSALRLAQRFASEGYFVRFLGLYDPVDMTLRDFEANNYTIPRKVQRAISLFGKEDAIDNVDYDSDSGFAYNWPRIIVTTDPYSQGGQSLIKGINATHGAFGGTPGYSPVKPDGYDFGFDVKQSIEIDSLMREEASAFGVPITPIPESAYGFPRTFEEMPQIAPVSSFYLRTQFLAFPAMIVRIGF
jgi:pimeloyl-ACP methyl ester carboxylesterase